MGVRIELSLIRSGQPAPLADRLSPRVDAGAFNSNCDLLPFGTRGTISIRAEIRYGVTALKITYARLRKLEQL
jgi:hypothetical protein